MAAEQDDSNLEYMELAEFAKNKNKNDDGTYNYLDRYINLDNVNIIKSQKLSTSEDINFYNKNIEDLKKKNLEKRKLKEEEKKEKEEKKKKNLEQKKDWENAKISNTVESFTNFISKYPESLSEIEQAQTFIKQIKQDQEKQKQEELQKEANEKWLSIQKVDSKFKQKALEDFIQNYPNSEKIEMAKKELELLSIPIKSTSNVNLDDLNNAKDGKRVKSILEKLSNIDDKQKVDIFNMIKTLYPTLKSKEQKNFFKDAQLARFIGVEIETNLKNELN
jgi:hypothetical protein